MKRTFTRRLLAVGGLLMAAAIAAPAAIAQEYPNRPIRLVVGYGSGGSPDAVARVLAGHLATVLGQAVIVDNKPGASGTLATTLVAQSPPDGYTLLVAETGQLEIAPQMMKLPYDSIGSFTHIGLLTRAPMVIVTHTKRGKFPPFQSIQEVLATAKANPGKINFGTSGIGSGQHLAWEVLKERAEINLTHVPYKGATQSVPALLAGDVELLAGTFGSFEQHIKAGNLRPLAIASNVRLSHRTDLPALSELVKGYEDYSSEIGLMAPRGLPSEILKRLSDATRTVLEMPEARSRLDGLGLIPHWSHPQAYRDAIVENQKKYKLAITLSGIKAE